MSLTPAVLENRFVRLERWRITIGSRSAPPVMQPRTCRGA